jgi:hypothetical protein
VQPFAADLSEYIWFRRVGRERASVGWVPDIDEARRALVFAVGSIVRWEIFTFGYPEERWQDYRDGIQPPTHGDGGTVTITGGQTNRTLEAPGQPARNILYLQLANVPNRGRPPWEAVLQQAIADGMRGLGTEGDDPIFLRAHWTYSGLLAVTLNLDADATVVADALEQAILVAGQRHAEFVADSEEKETRRRAVEERLRARSFTRPTRKSQSSASLRFFPMTGSEHSVSWLSYRSAERLLAAMRKRCTLRRTPSAPSASSFRTSTGATTASPSL